MKLRLKREKVKNFSNEDEQLAMSLKRQHLVLVSLLYTHCFFKKQALL